MSQQIIKWVVAIVLVGTCAEYFCSSIHILHQLLTSTILNKTSTN